MKTAVLLLVIMLSVDFSLSVERLNALKSSCTLEQPHITYGDQFHSTAPGSSIWTVSAVSRDGCTDADVLLRLNDGTSLRPVSKNAYYDGEKEYRATSFFFSITKTIQLKLLKSSTWIIESPNNKLGPFPFPQTSASRAFSPSKWLIIADMDDSEYSASTIDRLTNLASRGNYDGVIHNGDYAYNIHNSKGKVGDGYFSTFSKISTRIPYIVTPGNHEYYDTFKMFNYRFKMPGAGNGLTTQAANYYSFIVKGIYFLTINWDYAFTKEGGNNFKEVFGWVKSDLERNAKNPEIVKRVFFTHKPFYCTFATDDCTNFYLFKPVESLLYKYNFDLILNAHVHLYYRNKKIDKNFRLVADGARVPPMFISGHQGVSPDRGGNTNYVPAERRGVMEKVALAGTPNYLEMESSDKGILLTLRDCFDMKILDQVLISNTPTKMAY